MFDIFSITSFLKKTFSKKDVLLISLIILLYFVTRLINLEILPIFSDEGIYIHWAKVAWHDAAWRFISLTDGKPPLQTWGTIPFLKLFPDNALLAGRLFSVATGFTGLIGIFTLLYYLFGKRAAFFAAFFYVFTPYFLFYDRIALVDSAVNAFFIWILLIGVVLAETRTLGFALLFGLIGGLGLFSKASFRIFIALAVFGPVLFFEKNVKKFFHNTVNFLILFGMGAFLSLLIYNVQRLSPFFHYIEEKNTTFVLTLGEFIKNPTAVVGNNIKILPYYIFSEMGYFLGICGVVGLYFIYKKNARLAIYLTIWFTLPFLVLLFLSEVIFPRYVIFFATLLTIFASYLFSIQKGKGLITLLILYTLSVGYFNYTILFDPVKTPFPAVDRGQYIEGWTAGWGMKEVMEYAREKSKEKPVIIVAEGNFGLAGDVLDTFLKPNDRISVRGYWPLNEKELLENQKDIGPNYVFVVAAHKHDYPREWPLKLIKKYEKPNKQSAISFFELTK